MCNGNVANTDNCKIRVASNCVHVKFKINILTFSYKLAE